MPVNDPIKNSNVGKKQSPETIAKRVAKLIGQKRGHWTLSPETCKKMSDSRKGHKGYWTGKTFSEEHKRKIGLASKGKIGLRGEKSGRWIKDRSKIKKSEDRRLDHAYHFWREDVKNRDNRKCKMGNKDCRGRLEAHHILGWTEYPELRYDLNNGITLCLQHHPRSRLKEKELSPYFKELIKQ